MDRPPGVRETLIFPEATVGKSARSVRYRSARTGIWRLFHPKVIASGKGSSLSADAVSAAMRYAGAVRIDHAAALRRLFLAPLTSAPEGGAYVNYPKEELLQILGGGLHRVSLPGHRGRSGNAARRTEGRLGRSPDPVLPHPLLRTGKWRFQACRSLSQALTCLYFDARPPDPGRMVAWRRHQSSGRTIGSFLPM